MGKRSKRLREIAGKFNPDQRYTVQEAVELLQQCPPVKFDQSVDVNLKSGIDAKKSDQQVRGTVSLPHGTGKAIRTVVFARGDKAKEAQEAGADVVGSDELFEKVKGGWTDFDVVVATPDMMRDVGKLGKVLGPRGLMPTPKAGTVTTDPAKAVRDLKAGRIEFKNDKGGNINSSVGKLSFDRSKLIDNIEAYFSAVTKAKPATAKGDFIRSFVLSSTMGPGLKIDLTSIAEA